MDEQAQCDHHVAKSYDNLKLRKQDLFNNNHFEGRKAADEGLNCEDVKGEVILV